MATTAMARDQELELAVDTFAALEQRVVRAIELLNQEREQRAATEKQMAGLREQLETQQTQSADIAPRDRGSAS